MIYNAKYTTKTTYLLAIEASKENAGNCKINLILLNHRKKKSYNIAKIVIFSLSTYLIK